MAITDHADQEVIKFAGKERLRYSDVFSEKVSDFDPEFWEMQCDRTVKHRIGNTQT